EGEVLKEFEQVRLAGAEPALHKKPGRLPPLLRRSRDVRELVLEAALRARLTAPERANGVAIWHAASDGFNRSPASDSVQRSHQSRSCLWRARHTHEGA